MSGGKIETPRCDEWRNSLRRKFVLLEEFGEWYNRYAIENHDSDCCCGVTRALLEKFITEEYEFDFNELEEERRTLLEIQRALNEKS